MSKLEELQSTLSKQDGYAYNIVNSYLNGNVNSNWAVYQLNDRLEELQTAQEFVIQAVNLIKERSS
jgi:hypothetical protein